MTVTTFVAPHWLAAEALVHAAFVGVDPSARHVGGNGAVRDHELFDNTVWCNTKTGWFDTSGQLGFSPVNWTKARPAERASWLDLVAVVPLRPDSVEASVELHTLTISWAATTWYLFPASTLYRAYVTERSRARAHVPLEFAARFAIEGASGLSLERLRESITEERSQWAALRGPASTSRSAPGDPPA